jgi:nucleosome binding factor SPN SPT16 subunit
MNDRDENDIEKFFEASKKLVEEIVCKDTPSQTEKEFIRSFTSMLIHNNRMDKFLDTSRDLATEILHKATKSEIEREFICSFTLISLISFRHYKSSCCTEKDRTFTVTIKKPDKH